MDAVAQIARTLLYEGYVLWPYRRSAVKNQMRWTIGGAYPPAFAVVSGGTDRSDLRAEFLVSGPNASLPTAAQPTADISIRFLHVVRRQVMQRDFSNGAMHDEPVDELTVRGKRYLSWEEATERSINFPGVKLVDGENHCQQYRVARGEEREVLGNVPPGSRAMARDNDAHVQDAALEIAADAALETAVDRGDVAGVIVRSWEPLEADVTLAVCQLLQDADVTPLWRVSVTLSNTNRSENVQRESAIRHTFVAAHVTLHVSHAHCVSQFDPPSPYVEHATANQNEGLWPVLVGDENARDTMIASPIILYDYPRLAPESPGDLFDGGEIDQLLILNVLSLSAAEQEEMRDSDPRAREVLDRCLALSDDALAQLHGTVRSLTPVGGDAT